MRVIENLNKLPASALGSVVALGNFDGLHRGHQAILTAARKAAKKLNFFPAVFTFSNHPQQVLSPHKAPALLTPIPYRLSLMEKMGIKNCFLIPFNKKFSGMSAEDFVKEILLGKLKVKGVALGKSARFGHGRKGDGTLMQKLSRRYGFYFKEIPEVLIRGKSVSSSRIRKLLEGGNLEEACECLGRPYGFFGRVVKGEGRGRKLGFPTANLELEIPLPVPLGVYAVRVKVGKLWRRGALNFGKRPTFHGNESHATCEVHILHWKKPLIGKTLEVELHTYLRPEKTFASAEALRAQIKNDLLAVVKKWCQA